MATCLTDEIASMKLGQLARLMENAESYTKVIHR